MVMLGPLVTLSAFSSCLGTILSGNIFACVTDIVYFVLGGIIFVAGVITAIIGIRPGSDPSSFVIDPSRVHWSSIWGSSDMQEM